MPAASQGLGFAISDKYSALDLMPLARRRFSSLLEPLVRAKSRQLLVGHIAWEEFAIAPRRSRSALVQYKILPIIAGAVPTPLGDGEAS